MSESVPKRILIVDDDPNINRFISESLRLRGYEVQNFASAEPALAALAAHRFDLALLDILLPGTSGLQLCRQLRRNPATADLPVIMMTAFYKEADHIREAREQYGATDYLLKPFSLKTLHERIAALVGTPAAAANQERLCVEGTLAATPFAHVVHNLYSLRATGLLQLERGDLKKVLYVKDGYPIFVRSNLVREFLGQILVRSGIISNEDLARCMPLAKESGRQIGTVLIEAGLLSPHDLNDLLNRQIVDKLLDIFTWPDGHFRFIQAREFKEGITSIDVSPANLILQGLRAPAAQPQVERLLAPHLDRYLLPAENPLYRFQEIHLSASEQRFFALCRGDLTPRDLLSRHQLSRHDIAPLLAALLATGILESRDEPAVGTIDDSTGQNNGFNHREEFLKEYAWMMQQDYFTLLGVSESDTRDQVRKAYYGLVKKYHPDRFFEQEHAPELRDKITAIFQRISDAHDTLIDPARKAVYIDELKGKKPTRATVENILQAETAFQKGLILERAKKYGEALEQFTLAIDLGGSEAEYLIHQAWSSYKLDPGDRARTERARQTLLRAVGANPRLALAHLYLGYISKNDGNEREAQRRFERAIQCNPNCTEALRELRLMNMRQEKQEKKGLFDLFRK
ncbi:MAG: response regulator [Deltaproteobacteria bacterium]|nr:MAG: response regulator [Deltaproteobacteria bacterium]